MASPPLQRWGPVGGELRWVQNTLAKADPEPKALACYGLLVRPTSTPPEQSWRRVVTGQPVSAITTQFLAECSEPLAAQGRQALLLIWDNAAWHTRHAVRAWLRLHNQTAKQTQKGVRLLACRLPTQSPWLKPIEPTWVHGKRAIVESERVLTAAEVQARVSAYYGCQPEPPLVIPQQAA